VTTREEERRRLRRDLHDGLGPVLASQTLQLDAALDLLDADPAAARHLLLEIKAQSKTTVADIRRLVHELRPPALDELGLVGALRAQLPRAPALLVTLHEPAGGLPPLSAAVEVAAYRIIMEAVTNAGRHARARRCWVRLDIAPAGQLQIDVSDDGQGLAGSQPGVGQASMRERALELGGQCAFETRAEGGTRVLARLPLAAA
jgi:signal transduction histidine kinase